MKWILAAFWMVALPVGAETPATSDPSAAPAAQQSATDRIAKAKEILERERQKGAVPYLLFTQSQLVRYLEIGEDPEVRALFALSADFNTSAFLSSLSVNLGVPLTKPQIDEYVTLMSLINGNLKSATQKAYLVGLTTSIIGTDQETKAALSAGKRPPILEGQPSR